MYLRSILFHPVSATLILSQNASDLLDMAKFSLRLKKGPSPSLRFAMNLVYSETRYVSADGGMLLTFPSLVMPYNIVHLKEVVSNGPTTYPGIGHIGNTGSNILTCSAMGMSMHFSKMVRYENGVWKSENQVFSNLFVRDMTMHSWLRSFQSSVVLVLNAGK
ncbi:hypothetical protein EV401DRAFT_1211804 [Pisolithus croceorrhizus]|nr:hypothetical protein EV401DRAFT_1211804 [Pisolithus croceorrhizus]